MLVRFARRGLTTQAVTAAIGALGLGSRKTIGASGTALYRIRDKGSVDDKIKELKAVPGAHNFTARACYAASDQVQTNQSEQTWAKHAVHIGQAVICAAASHTATQLHSACGDGTRAPWVRSPHTTQAWHAALAA